MWYDFLTKISWKNFSPFYFASTEIIEVKIRYRQTNRQILWYHIQVCVDFFFKLNFLPPYSLRSQGDNCKLWAFVWSYFTKGFTIVKERVFCSSNNGNKEFDLKLQSRESIWHYFFTFKQWNEPWYYFCSYLFNSFDIDTRKSKHKRLLNKVNICFRNIQCKKLTNWSYTHKFQFSIKLWLLHTIKQLSCTKDKSA